MRDGTAMVRMTVLALAVALGGVATAAETEAPAEAKCLKAEINPVTGHVLCIDPLGAPVEAPPEEAKLPCKPEDVRGQWSYGPNCTPVPEGM
jgi:hypothetical protein